MYGNSWVRPWVSGMMALPAPAPGAAKGIAGAVIGAEDYEIEVAGVRCPAIASLRPLYDPKNERIKC